MVRSIGVRGRVAAAGALLVLLTGCGGAGGAPESGPSPLPAMNAVQLTPLGSGEADQPFGEQEARHLLRRIAFGGSAAEVDRCVLEGLAATVHRLLTARDDAAVAAADALVEDPLKPCLPDLQKAWLTAMATTGAPAREKMAFLWHNHLAVSGRMLHGGNLRWMREYRDLLRTEAFGNWRRLLKALTKNGAMLVWLSGLPSDKRAPNENYAREFWELFTLGVDVLYTQEDVREAARAFTGWDSRWDKAQEIEVLWFDPKAHDDGTKTILGRTGTWGEEDVVDITLERPEAARWLATRLFAALAYPDPEPEIVEDLARLCLEEDYELEPLVRVILHSRAFYSSRARKAKVADPVSHMIGLVRTTGIPFEPHDLLRHAEAMGQVPLDPPSVKGWAQGLSWSGEQALLRRAAMADALSGKDHVHDAEGNDGGDVTVGHLLPPRDAEGRIPGAAVVDHLARLLDVALSPEERQGLVAYMDTVRQGDRVVPAAFDGNDAAQGEVKVRGLLSILAQHPGAMRN